MEHEFVVSEIPKLIKKKMFFLLVMINITRSFDLNEYKSSGFELR